MYIVNVLPNCPIMLENHKKCVLFKYMYVRASCKQYFNNNNFVFNNNSRGNLWSGGLQMPTHTANTGPTNWQIPVNILLISSTTSTFNASSYTWRWIKTSNHIPTINIVYHNYKWNLLYKNIEYFFHSLNFLHFIIVFFFCSDFFKYKGYIMEVFKIKRTENEQRQSVSQH